MKYLLFMFIALSPITIFAESASMETTWLIDKDRISGGETAIIKAYQFAKQFIDFSKIGLTSDCTRYAFIRLTTTTQAQNDAALNLVDSGKFHRLMDAFSVRNSLGGYDIVRHPYPFPLGWQNYSVKDSTPQP